MQINDILTLYAPTEELAKQYAKEALEFYGYSNISVYTATKRKEQSASSDNLIKWDVSISYDPMKRELRLCNPDITSKKFDNN